MKTLRIAVLLFACVVSVTSHAATQRTFVRSDGMDTNPCTIAQPCRGFARALTQTLAGGEIIVQDSAGYGPVTIAQSVSILSPAGIHAGISVSGGDGITINGAGIRVKLAGLTITGLGGANGIVINTAADVNIERCSVSGMSQIGLRTNGTAHLLVSDSLFERNFNGIGQQGGGSGTYERVVVRESGAVGMSVAASTAVLTASTIEKNGNVGLFAFNGSYLIVADSIIHQNANAGIAAVGGFLRISNSTLAVNGAGGVDLQATEAWLADNKIYDNGQLSPIAGEVCACTSGAIAFLSGNAIKSSDAHFPVAAVAGAQIVTFANNSLTGAIDGFKSTVLPQ